MNICLVTEATISTNEKRTYEGNKNLFDKERSQEQTNKF